MKTTYYRQIFLCLLLLAPVFALPLYAQTAEEVNHQRYWDYRNRFKKLFIKIGGLEGESLEINNRLEAEQDIWETCGAEGLIEIGDVVSETGYYLAVLASEYKLLSENHQDVTATLTEIYYALNAIRRLDLNYNIYHDDNLTNTLDGCLLRDDADIELLGNWQPHGNLEVIRTEAYYNKSPHEADACQEKVYHPKNTFSTDHIVGLFYGFYFLKKWVPNYYIRPTAADDGFNLISEMQQTTIRIMDFVSKLKTTGGVSIYKTVGGNRCVRKFYSTWIVQNPVTGMKIPGEDGGDIWQVAVPLNGIAMYLTGKSWFGNGLEQAYNLDPGSHWTCNFLPDEISTAPVLAHLPFVRDIHLPVNITGWAGLVAYWQNYLAYVNQSATKAKEVGNSSQMAVALFSITAKKDPLSYTWIKNVTQEGWMNTPFSELGYSVASGIKGDDILTSMFGYSQLYWRNRLHQAPICHNPNIRTMDFYPWVRSNSQNIGYRDIAEDGHGYFPGLDYMLTYNFYRIKFDNDQSLPPYKESSCECSFYQPAVADIEIADLGNDIKLYCCGRYYWKDQSLKTEMINSGATESGGVYTINNHFTKPRYHEGYSEMGYSVDFNERGIAVFEYLINNTKITGATAVFEANFDLKVCKNSTLEIESGGKFMMGGDDPNDMPARGITAIRNFFRNG